MTTEASAPGESVRLHPLHLRDEGDEWVVGRVDTGKFVALPPVGIRVIELLREHSVEEATKIVSSEQGESVDVGSFISALTKLGFVAEVDGVSVGDTRPVRSTFAGIRAEHVRWALHPLLPILVLATILAAGAAYIFHRGETIEPTDLVWSEHGSLVMASLAILMWSTVFLHEMAHLVTARAAGVPGKMSLGTRLQFLAAQTDVSGIWSAARPVRVTVYLSGMAVNAFLAAVGVLLASFCPPGPARTFGAILCVEQILLLSGQFMFFMRTDIYFLVQDLTRCRNLFRDATGYVSHLAARLVGRATGGDPTAKLPSRERRFVRTYAAFVVPASAITLGIFVFVTIPVTIQLLSTAIRHLITHTSAWAVIDGLTVVIIALLGWVLWARAWWRRHGTRLRTVLGRITQRLASATARRTDVPSRPAKRGQS